MARERSVELVRIPPTTVGVIYARKKEWTLYSEVTLVSLEALVPLEDIRSWLTDGLLFREQ